MLCSTTTSVLKATTTLRSRSCGWHANSPVIQTWSSLPCPLSRHLRLRWIQRWQADMNKSCRWLLLDVIVIIINWADMSNSQPVCTGVDRTACQCTLLNDSIIFTMFCSWHYWQTHTGWWQMSVFVTTFSCHALHLQEATDPCHRTWLVTEGECCVSWLVCCDNKPTEKFLKLICHQTVGRITYIVLAQTLNPAQSIDLSPGRVSPVPGRLEILEFDSTFGCDGNVSQDN